MASSLPVHIAPLLYINEVKKHPLCPFILIHFRALTLLPFCETRCRILERFQKLPLLCVHTMIKCVFKNLHFCEYPLSIASSKTFAFVAFCADQCEHIHKKGGFLLRFYTRGNQCERSLSFKTLVILLLHCMLCYKKTSSQYPAKQTKHPW